MFGIKRLRREVDTFMKMIRHLTDEHNTHVLSVPASAHQREWPIYPSPGLGGSGLGASNDPRFAGNIPIYPEPPLNPQQSHVNACLFCGRQREKYSENISFCPGCGLLWATDGFRTGYSQWKHAETVRERMKKEIELKPNPRPDLFKKNGKKK